MLPDILQLAHIAQKSSRTIIGLMSGTSLDGLDMAICALRNNGKDTEVKLLYFETASYDDAFKAEIRKVFAQKQVDFQFLAILNVLIAEKHALFVNTMLLRLGIHPQEIDLIASHGQTLLHAPRSQHQQDHYPNATLQMGDGDHIARRTGIITISDFRQKHLAGGGEGAPLALYGDYFLFSSPDEDRFLLNIGGIGNFTYLPANGHASDVFATDTGPGNTLMDAYARRLFEVDYDAGGAQAAAGVVDQGLLEIFKSDPFFQLPFPKTTGPEQFSTAWADAIFAQHPKGQLNPFNQMATLNRLSAETIADALKRVQGTGAPKALYLSGGGNGNATLVRHLKQLLPDWKIKSIYDLGIPADAKEAVLFAVLANEAVAGKPEPDFKLGGLPYLSMGKISLPN